MNRPATRRTLTLKTLAAAGVFVCALLLLTGCASPQMIGLEQHWPQDLPSQAELKDVAFFPQEDHECGPASLATVFQSAGVAVTPEQLLDQVYLPGRQGSLQVEMQAATRRNGLSAYVLTPDVQSVLHEVAAGNPVLVLQNLSLPFYPVWHYAVVIGYDRDKNVVILHSGRTARMEMSLFTFERTWARSGYWAMVALPPQRLPATASPEAMAQTLAALERVHPVAARTAYASALKKWPDQRTLLLGAGNTAYALRDLPAAQLAYQTAVAAHPDFADAWNNLAQVLLDQGQRTDAARAIAKAVALGGVRLSAYLELQAQINAR